MVCVCNQSIQPVIISEEQGCDYIVEKNNGYNQRRPAALQIAVLISRQRLQAAGGADPSSKHTRREPAAVPIWRQKRQKSARARRARRSVSSSIIYHPQTSSRAEKNIVCESSATAEVKKKNF